MATEVGGASGCPTAVKVEQDLAAIFAFQGHVVRAVRVTVGDTDNRVSHMLRKLLVVGNAHR